ncbi:tRNA pseudouridine(38-40) synthase TruA [Myxococcota bacterium]|nr:tRNA pseudouridine(38-40) synthase TruA [Myxococcota bacterium]
MQTWRLDLSWDGRGYLGWQRQPQGPTVQQAVEEALARVLAEPARVDASGRTDAGVHALHQVAAFRTAVVRTPRGLVGGLNHHLPRDIACLDAQVAPEGFDPRRWTRGKLYRYRVLVRRPRCPFRQGLTWHLGQALDVDAMARAAAAFPGTHDFSSFQAQGCSAEHPVRRLASARVLRHEDEVWLELEGHGFLRHQVRIMAGTLVEVGLGRQPEGWPAQVLAARDRTRAGPTLPAEGLWLVRVDCPMTPRPGHLAAGEDDPDPGDT